MNNKKTLLELGRNAKQRRIDFELRQEDLATNAGVSLSTLKAFEAGRSISTAKLVKILSQLDCLDAFEQLIPEVAPNPIDLLKLEGKTRQRVR